MQGFITLSGLQHLLKLGPDMAPKQQSVPQMMKDSHGCVCSCVGPVIDARYPKYNLFYKEKFILMIIIQSPQCDTVRDLCLPSVYDAFLVIRGSCSFRDGRVIKNPMANCQQHLIQLAFNDRYLSALIHLIPTNYSETLHTWKSCDDWLYQFRAVADRASLGLLSVFLLMKSYASCLLGELSQLCDKAILRRIALATSVGLSTWRSLSLIGFIAVIVVVGRIALGRIFNVVGSIIDPYIEKANSCQFNTTNLYEAV